MTTVRLVGMDSGLSKSHVHFGRLCGDGAVVHEAVAHAVLEEAVELLLVVRALRARRLDEHVEAALAQRVAQAQVARAARHGGRVEELERRQDLAQLALRCFERLQNMVEAVTA